jgi:hypothetical protein
MVRLIGRAQVAKAGFLAAVSLFSECRRPRPTGPEPSSYRSYQLRTLVDGD